jgi:hypothetical protein
MAQVTISGSVAAGFKTSVDKDNVSSRGFGFDDNEVRFSVAEDLGGGLKATATMTIEGFGDKVTPTGDGVTLGLSGGFGTIALTQVGGSDFLPVDGLTANADGTTGDRVAYSIPAIIPGLTATVSYKDGSEGQGYGKRDSAKTSTNIVIGYKTGPLSAELLTTNMTARAAAAGLQSRVGFKVGYDFGVAAISYGQLKSDNGTNADNTETGLTITAPLGPVTVGAAMATSKDVGDVKRDGSSLSVSYALSKRTSLAFYNESYDNATAGNNKVKETSLLLAHKF